MAVTADILTDRYGAPDGHQPLTAILPSGVTVYRGTFAGLNGTGGSQGKLKNMDTTATTDIVLGIVNKAGSGWPNDTQGITGDSGGKETVEIETGSFIMASGTGADALTIANVGGVVYVVDSQTVGATNGSSSRPQAGILLAVPTNDASIPTGFCAVKVGSPNSPLGGP